MMDSYKNFASVYNECGISDYSLTFGKSMLKFFEDKHSNEQFVNNLDICCGTGTLCNFFHERGIKTKGIDISHNMLNIAKDNYPYLKFVWGDATNFKEDKLYDFISCTDDALNHIIGKESFESVIKNVSNCLRSGGYFIFDLIDPSFLKNNESYYRSVDSTHNLQYNTSVKDDIVRVNVNYFEEDKLIFETSVTEQMYHKNYVISVLNNELFDVELCTSNFYYDTRKLKWKFIARKR